MAVTSIQLGQVWRSEADGQDYLVTKGPQGATLPGYAFTQEESF